MASKALSSPLSSPSDRNFAARLQKQYLLDYEHRKEEERLGELAARQLEKELKKEKEEAVKRSEKLAQQLDRQYRAEERKRELELHPDVLAQVLLDSPPVARQVRGRTRPTRIESPFLLLQAMSEDSPDWHAAFQSCQSPRLPHAPASPISFAALSSPLPRSYTSRSRRQRASPLVPRAVRRRAGPSVDVDSMSYEELQRLCERNGDVKDKAATASAVSRLPTAEVKSPQEKQSDDNCCSICLEPFKKKQIVKTLPCFHRFHVKEIDKWLQQNNSCPICKQPIDA